MTADFNKYDELRKMLQIDLGFSRQFTSSTFSTKSSIDVIFNLIMTLHKNSLLWLLFFVKKQNNCRLLPNKKEASPIMIFNCKHCGNKFAVISLDGVACTSLWAPIERKSTTSASHYRLARPEKCHKRA